MFVYHRRKSLDMSKFHEIKAAGTVQCAGLQAEYQTRRHEKSKYDRPNFSVFNNEKITFVLTQLWFSHTLKILFRNILEMSGQFVLIFYLSKCFKTTYSSCNQPDIKQMYGTTAKIFFVNLKKVHSNLSYRLLLLLALKHPRESYVDRTFANRS